MKTQHFLLFVIAALVTSCGPSPIPESYRVQMPPSPPFRTELLGKECRWLLEWYDSGGKLRRTEIPGNDAGTIDILNEWPSAVLAWPYWPEKSIVAGFFYPAGALFPFDAADGKIILSWEAGVEAYFYRELDRARSLHTTNRMPEYFDWKRFRTLLREEAAEELRIDPWLADWKGIAENTVRSGFRRSLIRAESRDSTEIVIPHAGPWLGASPFRPVEFWEKGGDVLLLLSSRPEIFVCPGGILSASSNSRLWNPFP